MLNIPDLNRLKVFYVVFVNKSLIGASKTLNITRSAVSQSLKALEEELQAKLFIRDSKKVMPTEPAEQLFRSLEPFMSELQATIRQLETGKTSPVGHLRIGAPQDFGSVHLTEAIVEFRKTYPEITFELILAVPVTLLNLLSEGKLDMAFVDNGDFHAKNYPVSIVTVMKEKFVLVCSKRYFEERVKQANPRFAELKNMNFVDYLPHAPVAKIWIKHHFGKSASNLKIVFSAESVRAVIKATQGGLGLGVIPEHLIEADLKAGRLKALFPGERELVNQIALTRRLERPITARENLFVNFYRSYVGRDR